MWIIFIQIRSLEKSIYDHSLDHLNIGFVVNEVDDVVSDLDAVEDVIGLVVVNLGLECIQEVGEFISVDVFVVEHLDICVQHLFGDGGVFLQGLHLGVGV